MGFHIHFNPLASAMLEAQMVGNELWGQVQRAETMLKKLSAKNQC